MRSRSYFLIGLLAIFCWSSINVVSQSIHPTRILTPVGFDKSERLDQLKVDPPGYRDRSWKEDVIPNKDGFKEEFKKPASWTGPDPVWQDQMSATRSMATIGENFPGMPNISGYAPPDTDGDVGPNHYMQMVNCTYQIFDKSGNSLLGPYDNSTLWNGFPGPWSTSNDGDPIVVYDEYADRWVASQFALPNYPSGPFYELIAVSETGDPTGSWYRYAYEFSNLPDYPKFGVWHDGYYFTINQFAPPNLSFAGAGVCVVDRDAMINGDPTAELVMFTTSYGSLLPADADGGAPPPAGSPNYMMSLEYDYLRIWEVDMDWNNTGNSTMNFVSKEYMSPFSWSGISTQQPGTSVRLDQLSTRLMNRLQYRNFGTHEVLLTNHSVNADGSGQGGVRWYELRNTGGGWDIYQQGTFAPADGDTRWMGSVAMNGNGDIGIGYSVTSSSTYPSIRFAGQTAANSGTGILDVFEMSIKEGTASQTGPDRWGDYAKMAVDPTDDQTFWFTTEYSNGGWSWRTQIASFNLVPPVVVAPIADFTGTPNPVMQGLSVTYTDQSQNNPTSWLWTFEGGNPATSSDQNPVVSYPTLGEWDVSLKATNSAGNNTKSVVDYIEVVPYSISWCTSKGNNSSSEWIERVVLGTFSNTSGNDGGYGDHTSPSISVESGQAYNITLSPDFPRRSRREFWRVWIDINFDGDFTDAGEEVFAANAKKNAVNGTITMPAGLNGETRMRVSMRYNATPLSCGNFAYGEVEDYTLVFGTPVPQPPVANFEGNPTSVNEGDNVQFTDLSTNNPTSWLWDFGDGNTSTDQNPINTYTTEGSYTVTLTATNDEGSDLITFTDYISVTPTGTSSYCPSSSGSNALDWIGKVEIGGFVNTSGASLYSDFTADIVGLTPGGSASVTLTPVFPGKTQREFWRIWIDFNGNGDFEDTGEQVFAANNKRNVVSGTINIPAGVSGQTRMRITMKNGGSPGPCGTFSNGEVEDYTVDFASAPSRMQSMEEIELKLYPNPASTTLNIEISGTNETINIKIYSALGVIIDEFNVDGNQTQLDLGNYTEGIYYVGAEDSEQYTLKKFIKK